MDRSREEFEVLDGNGGEDGPYISVSIPPEWLTDEANESLAYVPAVFVSIADLFEDRLSSGPDDCDMCSPAGAIKAISALRRYADELERLYVPGAHAEFGSIDIPGAGLVTPVRPAKQEKQP